MKYLAFFLLVLTLFFQPAFASTSESDSLVSMGVCEVSLPKEWRVLTLREIAGAAITVLGTKNRDSVVTVVTSTALNANANTIAEAYAMQYQGSLRKTHKQNQASFKFENIEGNDGVGYVTVVDNVYLVVMAEGNISKARHFIHSFTSEKFSQILSQF